LENCIIVLVVFQWSLHDGGQSVTVVLSKRKVARAASWNCVCRYWELCSIYMQNHGLSYTAIWNQRTFFYHPTTYFLRFAL